MPLFRNLSQYQSRHSSRLENLTPIAYDVNGWQVPLEKNTLQDVYLTRGNPRLVDAPPAVSARADPSHQEIARDPSSSLPHGTDDLVSVGHHTRDRSASASSSTSSSSTSSVRHTPYQRKASHARRAEEGHIPRPRNAFIIFRSWYNVNNPPAPATDGAKTNQNEVSRQAGKAWRMMSPKERQPFVEQSRQELAQHHILYPDYRYAPSGKKLTAKPKVRPRQKRKRVVQKAESDEDQDDAYDSDLPEGPISPPARSLRPRSARVIDHRSPSLPRYPSPPSPTPTPSPHHSAPSSSSGSEEEDSNENGFVATDKIPELNLPPRAWGPVKKEGSPVPQFDNALRPPNMDDFDSHFGFKSHLSPSALLTFLPPLPKCDQGEADLGWNYKPDSSSVVWKHVGPPPSGYPSGYLWAEELLYPEGEELGNLFELRESTTVISDHDPMSPFYDMFDFKKYYT